jgi:hypothetical protein
MKRLFKEIEITAGGGNIALTANSPVTTYIINGSDVTLTSGLTVTLATPSKACEVHIMWIQNVTIGVRGSITILGNAISRDLVGGVAFRAVYSGSAWKVFAYYPESQGTVAVDNSNVAYVNYDLTANDTNKKVFKTYADAISFITTAGTATTDNHWTVKMPSGYCDEAITLKQYIDIQGTAGTKIKSVTSNVAFVSSNVYDSVVYDCAIKTAYVAEAKTANFVRCQIANITPVLGAGAGQLLLTDCTIKSADFSNSESIYDWSGNKFYATDGNILMSGITHNVKDSEIVAYGANNVSLPDSMINCFISIPTITTTRKTSISGGKVVATTITAGADLSLLNTDIGAADVTMATATNLTKNAVVSSGTITLDGTSTKKDLGAGWNGGDNSGKNATAFGTDTEASGDDSIAMGNRTIASGTSSLAAGVYAESSGHTSFAIGSEVVSSGDRSLAIGNNGEAPSYAETVMGHYSTTYVPSSAVAWDAEDRLFVIGNGTSDIARADALIVYKSGKVKLQNILNLTPLSALPAAIDSEMGDIAVKDDGTIWFFDGSAWQEIQFVAP